MASDSGASAVAEKVSAALAAGDLSTFGDLLHPSVHWGPPGDPSPPCQSRKQVLAWYERARDAGMSARVVATDVFGDRIVVGLSVVRGAVAQTGAGPSARWQVLTVSDGRVTDIVGFEQRSEAVRLATTGTLSFDRPARPLWRAPRVVIRNAQTRLRLPESRDAPTLQGYAGDVGGLDGAWLPLVAGAGLPECEALIADWRAGWRNERSFHGPALAVMEAGSHRLIGQVGLGDLGDGVVELVSGIAPTWRGRGHAGRATRAMAEWLLETGLAREVELRVGREHAVGQRVARAAGFLPEGTVEQFVPATGETFQDLRYVSRKVIPSPPMP